MKDEASQHSSLILHPHPFQGDKDMNKTDTSRLQHSISRRSFLKLGGGVAAVAAGAYLVPQLVSAATRPAQKITAPIVDGSGNYRYHLVATDGWVYFPGQVDDEFNEVGPVTFHPDPYARAPQTTYAFGFRDVTNFVDSSGGLTADEKVRAQANHVQGSAPFLYAEDGKELRIELTNMGLLQRPDLTDGHTIHFHGFPNAIPAYDGVPELSVGVPIGNTYMYYYKPHDPGTYMYHCHFEDVEHVSMGMTGVIYIRPAGNPKNVFNNDGGASAYDREFPMILAEVWAQERWRDAHIQENDWSDYKPDFWTINGRVYPYTTYPNGQGSDPDTGDLIAPAGHPELQYQPVSSLVTCNAGEKVLIRVANLGFQEQTMRADGIPFRVVGKDAKFLGAQAYDTDSVDVGVGESFELLFTAPAKTGPGAYDTYMFYNSNMARLHNPGDTINPLGGQMTEIRVYGGSLPAQTGPNEQMI
jgi:FtsP/CotA-like multicopper oxidase with cupredoxin domain